MRRSKHKETGAGAQEPERRRSKKERVLHTRISEKLAADIVRVAEDLRVPVSNLVRNVLEDTFSMVEQVTGRVGHLMDNVLDETERARTRLERQIDLARRRIEHTRPPEKPPDRTGAAPDLPEFPDIIGWQPLLLNQAQRCAACGTALARGDAAVVGMTTSGLSPTYLCRTCIPA